VSDTPTAILAEIIRLAHTLPNDAAAFAEISATQRQRIRKELEALVLRLNNLAHVLDDVRQPRHVFDPTSAKVIGELVARTLLLQEKEPLSETAKQPFYGAGVYAIYYRGAFDCYAPISGKDHPLYVGKADPDAMHALTPSAQGLRLFKRLKEHWNRSITKARNLNGADFDCRYLVVKSAWVETAEDHLIDQFQPVWNDETKICYGFGKHGDSAETRKNERSPWDTLHPGRPWATSEKNTPNRKSIGQIKADIAQHFKLTLSSKKAG
jgi:hypothetical protein